MMFTWVILPIIVLILVAIYLFNKVYKGISYFFSKLSKKIRIIISIIVFLAIALPAVQIYSVWFIILLHFTALLLLIDGVAFVVKRIKKSPVKSKVIKGIYRSGVIAMVITAIILGYGYYNIFQVVRTEYTINTDKKISHNGYKIALLSDLHYGITLDQKQLNNVVDRINKEKPDIVVLDGDIVDENTTLKQMKEAFYTLGKINSTYGTYYVYGNHDKNVYTSTPNYSIKELSDTIKNSNIKILEDNVVTLNKEITLVGRADKGDGNNKRKSIAELVKNVDKSQEIIVLDHQPLEYSEVEKQGSNLILSGHTHAGQIFPAGVVSSIFSINSLNYGNKQFGNMSAVVTSGVAGWGYPIRTEKHSEYVIINLKSK